MTQAITPYPAEYFTANAYGLDVQRAEMYLQERRRLLAYKQSGAILDVGCGTGDFMACFGDQFRKFGIEPSRYAAKIAYSKGVEMIEDIPALGAKSADMVIYRGTIQHIDEPFASIREAVKVLKEDGLLVFLATPNAESLCYKLFGTLPALDPPHNFWIPGARELTNVLQNLGAQVIRIEYPYYGTPYARPGRDVMSFIKRLAGAKVKFPWPGNMMEVYAVRG